MEDHSKHIKASGTAKRHKHDGMGSRGVSRPMSMHESMKKEQGGDGHAMDRMQMLHKHHRQTLWIYWTIILLGIWMVLAPLTFSYANATVEPSGGRQLWISLTDRITVLKWSDIISGIILIIFGWRALTPNRPVSLWICCFIGIWLNFAPLIFWAPSPVIYLNDTLTGVLLISLTVLIPGMPNMIMYMKMGSEVPPGWSYNPSSWPQRWIMIVTGFMGWVVSRYLATYQLGYIDHAWDPFFSGSTEIVLNSKMSQSLPVSDAGLGALAYMFEFLMGWMGSPSRWRTMPWMVTFFGILVIPLGLVHIFLVISQPLVVGAWCTFCLLAAGIMLPMIPLEVDEVVAMGQHLVQARRNGESFWKVFWKGGKPVEQNKDERSPALMELPQQPGKIFRSSVWGMSAPWTLTLSACIGIYLMAAPALFGINIKAFPADVDHLCGALIVVVSVISMGEVVRTGRFLNVLIGAAIAILTWFATDNIVFNILNTISGAGVAALAIPKGSIKEQYGLWSKYIK